MTFLIVLVIVLAIAAGILGSVLEAAFWVISVLVIGVVVLGAVLIGMSRNALRSGPGSRGRRSLSR